MHFPYIYVAYRTHNCMDIRSFDHDIRLLTIEAPSFPEGIMDAHEELLAMIPFSDERLYFGLSRPENGTIVYFAATEELQPGEAEKWGCGTLILKKGNYLSLRIEDYMKDISAIGRAFDELLKQPGIDPNGYCVEWYTSTKDVNCMVRLSMSEN